MKFISLRYKTWAFALVIVLISSATMLLTTSMDSAAAVRRNLAVNYDAILRQAGMNLDYIFSDSEKLSLYLIQNSKLRSFLLADSENTAYSGDGRYREAFAEVSGLLSEHTGLHSIYIQAFDGKKLSTASTDELIPQEIEASVRAQNGMYLWYENSITFHSGIREPFLSQVRMIRDIGNITRPIGLLKINIAFSVLDRIFANFSQGDSIYLLDRSGSEVFRHNAAEENDAALKNVRNALNGGEDGPAFYGDFLVIRCSLAHAPYDLVLVKKAAGPMSPEKVFGSAAMIGTLFIIAVSFAAAWLFSRGIIFDLNQLNEMIRKVENEQFDACLQPAGNDEVYYVIQSFNRMSQKIGKLINEVYLTTLKRREAEILALENQMDPHFIYNAFDMIYWSAHWEKAPETCSLIELYSKFMKLSLCRGNSLIPVREEVEYINSYFAVLLHSCRNTVRFSIYAAEDALNCRMIKIGIQPLVENAIHHGIAKLPGTGNLHVKIFIEDNMLKISVRDSACLMDAEEMNRLLTSPKDDRRGFAIRNIHNRIRLMFGSPYGLVFRVVEDLYSESVICLPVLHDDGTWSERT